MSTKKSFEKRRQPRPNDPSSSKRGRYTVSEYRCSVIRVTLQALDELVERTGAPVAPRRLVNYLRGNQAPPAPRSDASRLFQPTVQGLFWAVNAAWVAEVIDSLCVEGYIDETGERGRALTPSAAGKRVLEDEENRVDAELAVLELVPHRPVLGTNPDIEERLRELRRRIAREEGRPAFSVFSNTTLAYLACRHPGSTAELADIPGLGTERLRKYARRILAALRRAGKTT